MPLPSPDPLAHQHSRQLCTLIRQEIEAAGGIISFAQFMNLALYAPGFGYYAAGSHKFGPAGDFVTAPELSPLFAPALARQVAELMAASQPQLIEAGAGTGRLAADLLLALEALGQLPERYGILELSADLRERQATLIEKKAPHLLPRVHWLQTLPEHFAGVVLGNELIDAMPVHLVEWHAGPDHRQIHEIGVSMNADNDGFTFEARSATGKLREVAEQIEEEMVGRGETLPKNFRSEINLAGPAWAASWGPILSTGAVLLIDYGFPAHEYYHPQRSGGTLMCHYRHHAHPDPFYLPGLQDITAHVDFTALISHAFPAGLELMGYTSQGQFLLNCGILDLLEQQVHTQAEGDFGKAASVQAAQAVNKLVLPQEMGELFKVMVMGKNLQGNSPLLGFARGDRCHQL